MVGEIFAGLSALNAALNSVKALKDINDATVRNTAIIELLEKLLIAKETQSALLDRIGDLEKEIARFETWESEKQRYELKTIGSGSFVYALKESMGSAEPPHQICAACYQRGKKSLLQRVPGNSARTALGMGPVLKCPECKSEISG
jgi:hypothetical protein